MIILFADFPSFSDMESIPELSETVKLIAFSCKGDYGFKRPPGTKAWEEIKPYDLPQLINEMQENMVV